MQAHALDINPWSHEQIMESWYEFPVTFVINSLPTSEGHPFVCPLDKTPVELTKNPPIWFELTNLALVWEPQSTTS